MASLATPIGMVKDLLLIDCPPDADPRVMDRLHAASLAVFAQADVQVADHARAGDAGTQLYLLHFASKGDRDAFLDGDSRHALEQAWRRLGARWMIGDFARAVLAASGRGDVPQSVH